MGSVWSQLWSHSPSPFPPLYDVIIVGGGLAGLVAAARLSEVEQKRVLVIEAGSDRRGDPKIDTPGLLFGLWGDPDYDWNLWSEPQEKLANRQIPQPRGKVLGGSSAINVAAIVYPTRRDFDAWSKLGVQGWSYETLAPYYQKFHTYSVPSDDIHELLSLDYVKPDNQGRSGPLPISFPDIYGPFNKAWMGAFRGLGLDNEEDPILARRQGAFIPPNTVDPQTGHRSYAASAYLTPDVEGRSNLEIMTDTTVEKLLLKQTADGVTAEGVRICHQGQTSELYAHQVILAAGAIHTPQILELSGIGSRDILQQHGIDVMIDNPSVGENLQDHFFTSVSFEIADGQVSSDIARDPAVVQALRKEYNESGSGPLSGVPYSLAYTPPVDINGPVSSDAAESLIDSFVDLNNPSLPLTQKSQFSELRNLLSDPQENMFWYGLTPCQMNISSQGNTDMAQIYSPQRPENYVTFMVGLNHPLSRGSVHISSSATSQPPQIQPAYLSHPLDTELLARGTQFIENIANEPSMKPLLKSTHRIPSYATDLSDIETAKKVVHDRLWTSYHPSCTCPMMPREMGGVVNDRLLVHGTTNLRIIDASVFPMIVQGNIQSTVYAVAERACDLIKEDWR